MQKITNKIKEIANKKKYGTIKIICTYTKGVVNKVTIFDGEKVTKLNKEELNV